MFCIIRHLMLVLSVVVMTVSCSTTGSGPEQIENIPVIYKGFWGPGRHKTLSMETEWLASVGANTFAISVSYSPQGDGTFKSHRKGWESSIIESVKRFHASGIKVFLVVSPWLPWAKPEKSLTDQYLNSFEPAVLHWAEISEQLGIEMFSPANEPDHVISGAAASDWHQRILPKIRERYSGLVVAKMANPIFADYKGYDFIGITLLGKRNKESIRREVMQMKKLAKRDGVQGVMISEFSLPPGRSPERSRGPKPSGRKLANYLESVFEASRGMVHGYLVGLPNWKVRGYPAEDTLRKHFYGND